MTSTAAPTPYGVGLRTLRALVALAVAVLTAAVLFSQQDVRHVEAVLADAWLGLVMPDGAMVWGDSFLVHLDESRIIAFRITAECTIGILAAPILAFAAVMIGFTRVSVWRCALATIAGLGLVVLVNQLRLGLIAWATLEFGMDVGYEVSHTFVGSVMAIAGFAGAILLMLRLMGAKRRQRSAPRESARTGQRDGGRGRRAQRGRRRA